MQVLPYQSCISRHRGDTTTVVGVEGEASYVIATLHKFGGLSLDDAIEMTRINVRGAIGEPSPTGSVEMSFRLCQDCADRKGVTVSKWSQPGDPVGTYVQPPWWNDERSERAAS